MIEMMQLGFLKEWKLSKKNRYSFRFWPLGSAALACHATKLELIMEEKKGEKTATKREIKDASWSKEEHSIIIKLKTRR